MINIIAFLIAAAFALLALYGFFFANNPFMPKSGMDVFHTNAGWGLVIIIVSIIAFLVLATVAVLWLAKALLGQKKTTTLAAGTVKNIFGGKK